MILYIDTADFDSTHLALVTRDKIWEKKFVSSHNQSEIIISKIKNLLASAKVNLAGITKIAVVNKGPSFSRIRTGVVVANALAFSLQVPVLAVSPMLPLKFENLKQKGSEQVPALYDRGPNISKPKKKFTEEPLLFERRER